MIIEEQRQQGYAELQQLAREYDIPFRQILADIESLGNINNPVETNIMEELKEYYERRK